MCAIAACFTSFLDHLERQKLLAKVSLIKFMAKHCLVSGLQFGQGKGVKQ